VPEQESLIRSYAAKEKQITTSNDCFIGAGYNHCVDINFRAVNLFDALKSELAVEM